MPPEAATPETNKTKQARQLRTAAVEHKRRTGGKKAATKAATPAHKSKQPPTKEEIAAAKVKLENLAAEANARFERADKEMTKAEDHRLAAALQLKVAEELCKANGLDFKAWVEKNVSQKWETARKYLGIAKQPDPQKALADMREGTAKRNKKLRDSKKKAASAPGTKTRTQPDALAGYEAVKAAFSDLGPKEQVNFVRWAAKETGYKLVDELAEAPVAPAAPAAPAGKARDDGTDMPANLRRRRTAPTGAAA